jgi:hypothetical protein
MLARQSPRGGASRPRSLGRSCRRTGARSGQWGACPEKWSAAAAGDTEKVHEVGGMQSRIAFRDVQGMEPATAECIELVHAPRLHL